jgi:hypothetical protein
LEQGGQAAWRGIAANFKSAEEGAQELHHAE